MTSSEYRDLLQKTASDYVFDVIQPDSEKTAGAKVLKGDRVCFLRHDIDFDPRCAVTIAEIERESNIKATYTVLLSGEFYSPFERRNRAALRKIIELGHNVGLHFDPTVHDITSEDELEVAIEKEKMALQDLLGYGINMFSFHNTTPFSMSCRKSTYAGLANAYADFFQQDVVYTSDSNGYWRYKDWQSVLAEYHPMIQVLTHPIWWQTDNYLPPYETVLRNTLGRYLQQVVQYTEAFDGQDVRINHSALTSLIEDIAEANKAEMLIRYAQYAPLLALLRTSSGNELALNDVARRFLRCE